MFYKLDSERNVVQVEGWTDDPDELWKRVELTPLGDYSVSTIFFGVERGPGGLFESVVMDERGEWLEVISYASWDLAEEGHWQLVNRFWWEGMFPPIRHIKRGWRWLSRVLGWMR